MNLNQGAIVSEDLFSHFRLHVGILDMYTEIQYTVNLWLLSSYARLGAVMKS